MAGEVGEEDDYLSMAFTDTTASSKETSLQRTARLKKEAAERGKVLSKQQRAAREKAARDEALATQLSPSNKGAKIMAKMGFKGGALGKTEDGRVQPIELVMKEDRGGIGMDSEKKRKLREAASEIEGLEKRRKITEEEYRERNMNANRERRHEAQMWSAMKILEGFETAGGPDEGDRPVIDTRPLKTIDILWRPLIKRRREKERERRMRHDLEQSRSNLSYEDSEVDADDKSALNIDVEEIDEGDPEIDEFETLSFAERLSKITTRLREKYHYCFWCKYRYSDGGMEGCPGLTEEEHD
ncbi:hypothetical protein M433DRAFT_66164 [Acidomyces richmondensis BFW]|nr:MAG: hypothetical protein FE78DRAFT_166781 [Acidomyces sp. 'richmondensis']KYG45960.1 hypothetical protein M433DRAFT_66164 [Acidomyces richmondensis BFW]